MYKFSEIKKALNTVQTSPVGADPAHSPTLSPKWTHEALPARAMAPLSGVSKKRRRDDVSWGTSHESAEPHREPAKPSGFKPAKLPGLDKAAKWLDDIQLSSSSSETSEFDPDLEDTADSGPPPEKRQKPSPELQVHPTASFPVTSVRTRVDPTFKER